MIKLINKFDFEMPEISRIKCRASDFSQPVEKVTEFEKGFFEFLKSSYPDVPASIKDQKVITEDNEKKLIAAIEEFKKGF